MALKKNHKIQSSLASVEFINKELVVLLNHPDIRLFLKKQPCPTIQDDGQFDQIIENLKIITLAYHVEVLKQSLYEHKETLGEKTSSEEISDLSEMLEFLKLLRNGLLHTNGELIPKWKSIPKRNSSGKAIKPIIKPLERFMEKPFCVVIPVEISDNENYLFKEKSK